MQKERNQQEKNTPMVPNRPPVKNELQETYNLLEIQCNNKNIGQNQHIRLYSCQIRGMAPSQRNAMNCYNNLQEFENLKLEWEIEWERIEWESSNAPAIEWSNCKLWKHAAYIANCMKNSPWCFQTGPKAVQYPTPMCQSVHLPCVTAWKPAKTGWAHLSQAIWPNLGVIWRRMEVEWVKTC